MAKIESPYGFRARRRLDGLPFANEMRQLPIASGYATDILPGDLVILGVNGTIERLVGTALNQNVIGVFTGYCSSDSGQQRIVAPWNDTWKAGTLDTNAVAYIIDDPNVEFAVQADGPVAESAYGLNFALVNPAPAGRVSNMHVAAAPAANGPFKLVDFVKDAFSKPGDEFTDIIVKFNPDTHAYLSGTARAE